MVAGRDTLVAMNPLRAYDLHTHSFYSDGQLAPDDLVARAASNGVEVLALTDHDSTEGLAEARGAAQTHGIELVAGVEVSVTWNHRTVHIVGLGIDPAYPALQKGLRRLREFREWRAEEIGRRLGKAGIEGATEGARRFSCRGLVSRTHFAQHLVAAGHAPDIRRVFKRYLVQGKPGHVPGQWAALTDAVGWIRAAGGQAVIAHPARYKLSSTRLYRLLEEFREAGGEGIEVVCGSHSRDDAFRFAHLAGRYGFLASAGSDYHGPDNYFMDLGPLPPLPEGCVPIWQAWEPAPPAGVRWSNTGLAGG